MADTKRGIDAFGGNMPFLGGRRIATQNGDRYAEWLTEMYGATGDTDYVGYFFHRAQQLMAPAGSLGLIATNAIADGDNRRSILGRMLADDFHIYGADTAVPWPGNAQVLIATLFLERGLPQDATRPVLLDGRVVRAINSRLRSGDEWTEPEPLGENTGMALTGCFLRGSGFILEKAEEESLLANSPDEAEVVRPFLTGDDLSNSADQSPSRYVVDFRNMTLEEARRYPKALSIVEERVKPGRERLKSTGADAEHRKYWWRFANVRLELRKRATELPRMLATARVSKHSTFAFVPTDWTPSEQVVVFPLPSWTAFAVLQSRVHGVWVSLQATHMGQGLRYSAGECFTPYPFPRPDPRCEIGELEQAGRELYEARAALMKRRQIGLTQLHNELLDPSRGDRDLSLLRKLHRTLDEAVLAAYGWQDIAVPALAQRVPDFDDAVAGRLFALNALRRTACTEAPTNPTLKKAASGGGPGPRKASVKRPDTKKTRRSAG